VRPARRDFVDKEQLADALADAVAADLKAAIASRGAASLAVSGGTTPVRFFKALGGRSDVAWDKVTVTLVDERWVDEGSERSNARLVRLHLLAGRAAAATFIPLYRGGSEPDAQAAGLALRAAPMPLDALVLGMGNDGHTASFFPGGDTLAEALAGEGPVVTIRAPGAGEPRVTLTLGVVLASRALYLHIEGEDKAATLVRAEAAGPVEDMPVRAVLRQAQTNLTIFWCP